MQPGKKYYIYNYSDDEYFKSLGEDDQVSWTEDISSSYDFINLKLAKEAFDKLKDDWCVNLVEVDTKVIE